MRTAPNYDDSPDDGFERAASALPDRERGAQFNFAPSTRVLEPVAVAASKGNVVGAENVLQQKPTALIGNGSYVVLDFGREVGGVVSISFSAASRKGQVAGLAFSESSLYWGPKSDSSNGGNDDDGALFTAVDGASTYTMPAAKLRGGFRYLTIFLASTGWITLNKVSLDFSPDPLRAVPNLYANYFYTNDETLNRAWYAGAYTLQTNLARVNQGRTWPPPSSGWDNGATIGTLGEVILVDGAKRDRIVWPGDLGIAIPTAYVALIETAASKAALHTLFDHQGALGDLPFAGPPVNVGGSATYQLWALLGVGMHHTYANDREWLAAIWPKYKAGIAHSSAGIGASGLFHAPEGSNDWARDAPSGENIAVNALLYAVLSSSVELAEIQHDVSSAETWSRQAAALKVAVNEALWDERVGAYRDCPSCTVHPQDGNALAVWFALTDHPAKAKSISFFLAGNWNDKGARGPEFTRGKGSPLISTYSGSMELMSHFVADNDIRGLDMIRTMWGYMLGAPHGTGSTFWEGYSSSGDLRAYDGAYTSLSHGWGTGPTSALTFYVLGAAPEAPAGRAYHVIPHPGDLTHVEGDITFAPDEVLNVSYDIGASCSWLTMRVDARALKGSKGRIGVPTFGARHEIVLNGVVAWDGTQLVSKASVGSADADARYVYFYGVEPGLYLFTYRDGESCAEAEERWTFCGDENTTCTFTGTQRVRFGKDGRYSYGVFSDGVACDRSRFADPVPDLAKSCAVSPELYQACASEGERCSFTGTRVVRYGANGQWNKKLVSGGTPCNVATFGDPLPGVLKRCELL